MVEEPKSQPTTPGADSAAKEPEPKAESKGITFSEDQQAYLNTLLATAKREAKESAAKKFANHSDLEAKAKKLDELEAAKLNDEEKAAKRLKDIEDKIAEKDKALAERDLRDLKRSKIEQAIADGKMSLPAGKTVDSLVKRCLGTSEEEITSDVEELMSFFPKAEPGKGIGGGTQNPPAKPADLDDQIIALTTQAADPKIDGIKRSALQAQILALKMQKGGTIAIG